MRSMRMKLTFLALCVIAVAVSSVTLFSVLSIRKEGRREADQMLLLLCETGEKNLDYYFSGVQKSAEKIAAFVEKDLDGLENEQLQRHVGRVGKYFEETAYKTNGVLTYYYRIDPAVSDTVKGFWYTNLDGEGFVSHEVTDITLYDTQDTSRLVWFTVPKYTGKSIWLPPYTTENLNVRVISYNVPIYWKGQFVGVVGIEIDYSTMAKQVESLRLYQSGYAFLNDAQGSLFFHPLLDMALLGGEDVPKAPDGLISDSTFVRYTFEGVEKRAAWLPLENGMRLTVSVPVSETGGGGQRAIRRILTVAAATLAALSVFAVYCIMRITKPLQALARAAVQGSFAPDYSRDDEVGALTKAFQRLASRAKQQDGDQDRRVYVDLLTNVKNKSAFTAAIEALQERINKKETRPAFAVGVFVCDGRKEITEWYGRDKADEYLKTVCGLICRVFHHSPVFRIGDGEFAAIIQNDDYYDREALIRALEKEAEEMCAASENLWEQPRISKGIAVFDPQIDHAAIDTVRRADKLLYADQRARKHKE